MEEKQEGKESKKGCCGGGCSCGKVMIVIFVFVVGGLIGYLFGRLPSRHMMMGCHKGQMECMEHMHGGDMGKPEAAAPVQKK